MSSQPFRRQPTSVPVQQQRTFTPKKTTPEKKRGKLPVSLAAKNRANVRKLPLQITVALDDIDERDEGSPVPPGTLARTHGLQCGLSFGYEIRQLVKSPRARQTIARTRPLPAGPTDVAEATLYGRVIAACAEERSSKINRKVEKRKKDDSGSAPPSPSKSGGKAGNPGVTVKSADSGGGGAGEAKEEDGRRGESPEEEGRAADLQE